MIALPDPLIMCQDPPTVASLKEMDNLLLLILGAAVQCSQKEHLIASIKNLPTELQHAFVEKITEVRWPSIRKERCGPNCAWQCNNNNDSLCQAAAMVAAAVA